MQMTMWLFSKRVLATGFVLLLVLPVLWPATASAHGVSKRDASFVQSNAGRAIGPFLYLGAKHMVTGYDHLLFLVGVIFFLYKLRDVFRSSTKLLTTWMASSASLGFNPTPRPRYSSLVCFMASAWPPNSRNWR